MKGHDRTAILVLAAAGALWGLTVPLSKLSLGWLAPAWLTVARFAGAAPLLALAGRRGLRGAITPRIAASGAIGFGGVIVLQNAGVARTSVAHGALVVGAVPVLVALMTALRGNGTGGVRNWIGYAVTLVGVGLIAHSGGGGATPGGDLLVLASVVLSAAFIVLQPGLLAGRDAAAVTAVQFAAAALVALPLAALTEAAPSAPVRAEPMLALAALSSVGTLLPFWLFAFGQARVPADVAGAFVNLEPVVGAVAGWVAFGDAATTVQLGGALAVLGGIALSTARAPNGWDNAARWRAAISTRRRPGERDLETSRLGPCETRQAAHSHAGIWTTARNATRRARGDHAVRRPARNRASGGKPR